MTGPRHSMLVVDDSPEFFSYLNLIKPYLPESLKKANSSNEAITCIKSNPPFSIIWSKNRLTNPTDGMNLLNFCHQFSPLTARILHSENYYKKSQLESMASVGDIESYYFGREVIVLDEIISAIKIGLKFNEISHYKQFVDISDFNSKTSIETSFQKASELQKGFGTQEFLDDNWFDFENRTAEMNRLITCAHSIHESLPEKKKQLAKLCNTLQMEEKEKQKLELATLVRDQINFLDAQLTKSKQILQQAVDQASRTRLFIDETQKRIKDLKQWLKKGSE